MAKKPNDAQNLTKRQANAINKTNRRISGNISQLIDSLNTMTYGIKRTDRIDSLTDSFNSLIKAEVETISKNTGDDTTSFVTKLVMDNRKRVASDLKTLEDYFNQQDENLEAFFEDQYRNRLLKQADLEEVTSQLAELQEAVTVTRDAIIASDIVDGHMSRNLTIASDDADGGENQYLPVLEKMEKRFKLQQKIKNFIIPRSLTAGEYYSYTIPYSKIFENFMKEKLAGNIGQNHRAYESVEGFSLYEFVSNKNSNTYKGVQQSIYESVSESLSKDKLSVEERKEVDGELKQYMENIMINNDPIPLPVLEEGVSTMREFYNTHQDVVMESKKKPNYSLDKVLSGIDDGIHAINGKKPNPKKNRDTDFSNIKDCYLKLIDARHLLPIEIMNETIGYYYIQEEDITPMSGILTSSVYYNKFDVATQNNVLNTIADSIVNAFDRQFLEKNEKFKSLIVEALTFYKLNNKRLKFQFIPKEYIVPFKINMDENGRGVSIIEPSLFYAKLYLMLLLFKIYSIVQNSNDTKVNYIRQSGLDKNVINKVQEIARKKQQQQIQLSDMFTYTTVINKIGRGSEMYVPTGRSNERAMETEILSGQEVPLHNELMEMLKKGYISGTDVPDVLLNYLHEAEFAKTVELANNRFQGRIISHQLDYNEQITYWYRQIAKFSTTIPEHLIDTIEFSFIQPKSSNANITNDLINNHNTQSEFLVGLYNPDQDVPEHVQKFRLSFAKDRLSMLDWPTIDRLWKQSKIEGTGNDLNPDKKSGDESYD